MQSSRPGKNHGIAGIDPHRLVALAIKISEPPRKGLKNIFYATLVVLPNISRGILEIQHHARRARIQHLHHQVRFICGPSHLVALIRAPPRELNTPRTSRCLRGSQVPGQFPGMRFCQRDAPPVNKRLLSGRQRFMKWPQKLKKSRGQVAFGIKFLRRTIHRNDAIRYIRVLRYAVSLRGSVHGTVLVVFVVAHRNSMHNPGSHSDHDGVDSRIRSWSKALVRFGRVPALTICERKSEAAKAVCASQFFSVFVKKRPRFRKNMSPSSIKPDGASTTEIPHDFLTQLKEDIANRRIEDGLRCLAAHQQILESIQVHQNHSVILLGYFAQWVDVGFPGRALLRQLLTHFASASPESLTLLEYAHLRMAGGLVAMSEEDFAKAIKSFNTVLTLENEINDKQMISIANFWMGRCLRRQGRYEDALGYVAKARDLAMQLKFPKMAAVMQVLEGWVAFKKDTRNKPQKSSAKPKKFWPTPTTTLRSETLVPPTAESPGVRAIPSTPYRNSREPSSSTTSAILTIATWRAPS